MFWRSGRFKRAAGRDLSMRVSPSGLDAFHNCHVVCFTHMPPTQYTLATKPAPDLSDVPTLCPPLSPPPPHLISSPQDVFRQPLSPPHLQFEPMLNASPHLAEALQKVTTIGQMVLLVPVSQQQQQQQQQQPRELLPPLVVVNTHLFFHPYAPHIRSMHTAAMLEEAAAAIQVGRFELVMVPPSVTYPYQLCCLQAAYTTPANTQNAPSTQTPGAA
jgi:hypothetical protein